MRRASRQRTINGIEYDWTDQKCHTRRKFNLSKPGVGKAIKRALAKRRRREPIDTE